MPRRDDDFRAKIQKNLLALGRLYRLPISPTRVSQDRSKFQTKNMEANFSPDELPEGFSSVDPTGAGGSQDAAQAQKLAKEEQRRAILEQALTPEALARLGTIKVCVSSLCNTIL